jgi:hypothetical protein
MASRTVIFYTTQTSATASISRILTTINNRHLRLRAVGHELFTQGPLFRFAWSEVPTEGQLLLVNCPYELGPIGKIADQQFIVNFRDPRDRVCNEFMWRLLHSNSPDEPKEVVEARAKKMLEDGIDAWILSRLGTGPLTDKDYFKFFVDNLAKIPTANRNIITYARLCIDFDSFIERCCVAMGKELTPELKDALEVERTEKLADNPKWIGNQWSGSDSMPGRYRRELKPDTVAYLSERYAPVLREMARLDPDYASFYLEDVPAPSRPLPKPAPITPAQTDRRPVSLSTLPVGAKTTPKVPTIDGIVRKTIVDRADIQIDHFRNQAKNDVVVFTFSERTHRDLSGLGFATEFLLKNGVDVVAIKTNRDVWYENLFERDIREIDRWLSWTSTPYSQRLAYGSSMGAYAAIRFSHALRLDRVVALSPLFDIKHDWEKRWAEDLPALSADIDMLALPGEPGFEQTRQWVSDRCDFLMVFDPLDPDINHIRRFQRVIAPDRLKLMALPYAGHPAGQYLLQLKMLGDVGLTALKEGRFPSIAAARRQHKGQSSIYLFQLAEHCLRRGHVNWALAINERLIAGKDHPEYQLQAYRILRSMGRGTDAIAAVDRALSFTDYVYRPNVELLKRNLLASQSAAA